MPPAAAAPLDAHEPAPAVAACEQAPLVPAVTAWADVACGHEAAMPAVQVFAIAAVQVAGAPAVATTAVVPLALLVADAWLFLFSQAYPVAANTVTANSPRPSPIGRENLIAHLHNMLEA
jgi:hypothetical protein